MLINMKLTKEAIANESNIIHNNKRKRRCPLHCQEHQFKIYTTQHTKMNASVNFCPKYQRDPTPNQNTFPSFNNDRLYYTSSFTLDIDKKGKGSNEQLMEHVKMVRDAVEKNCKVLFPKPNPKHTLCGVCRIHYDNYYSHILSDRHLFSVRNCKYSQHIQQLTQLFAHLHPLNEQNISSPFKPQDENSVHSRSSSESCSSSSESISKRDSQVPSVQVLLKQIQEQGEELNKSINKYLQSKEISFSNHILFSQEQSNSESNHFQKYEQDGQMTTKPITNKESPEFKPIQETIKEVAQKQNQNIEQVEMEQHYQQQEQTIKKHRIDSLKRQPSQLLQYPNSNKKFIRNEENQYEQTSTHSRRASLKTNGQSTHEDSSSCQNLPTHVNNFLRSIFTDQ